YSSWSVITTCSTENLPYLTRMVELFHAAEVPTCMLNTVRCTLPGARGVKPADGDMAKAFFAALDRTYELYQETGRKLMVANFANILLAILAPTARRLMCDISPCGGGRAFFALAADGGLYPCSEFIGLPRFNGGNLLTDGVEAALKSEAFRPVITRDVDTFDPCSSCAIRHFCGSPCPAEAAEMNGGMDKIGAFCDFYKEQVNYALRLIADGKANDYLWDGWDEETETVFNIVN
ncbi:MAG: peptide-modifying radical SAM enzyme CbpB, partial [Rhodocyclaceae bacterium]